MLLFIVLNYREADGDDQGIALLKLVSPVTWQHINLYGRYEFSKSPEKIDIEAITQELSQVQINSSLIV